MNTISDRDRARALEMWRAATRADGVSEHALPDTISEGRARYWLAAEAHVLAARAERADTDGSLTASEPPVSTTEPGVGRPYVSHGFTPSSGPFDPDRCRVQLSRYPCPDGRDAHDPSLPPEDVDAFGRIRRADLERGEADHD